MFEKPQNTNNFIGFYVSDFNAILQRLEKNNWMEIDIIWNLHCSKPKSVSTVDENGHRRKRNFLKKIRSQTVAQKQLNVISQEVNRKNNWIQKSMLLRDFGTTYHFIAWKVKSYN